MSVAIKKVTGVQAVTVSLNKGVATINFKTGNTVRMQQLRDAVKKNGFTPKDAVVNAVGQLTTTDDHKLMFTVAGTGERFQVVSEGARVSAAEASRLLGTSVLVEGTVPENQAVLRLNSVDAVTNASK